MLLQYSSAQNKHLLQQNYENTNDIPLAIYAPERCPRLKDSLKRQLHWNFLLVSEPQEIEALDCAAVIVVADDGELMSTALMQYALETKAGHDFVSSDIVFDAEGEILCATSKSVLIASVKKELFLQVAEANCNRRELLCRAEALAKKRVHIPYALINCRRLPEINDLFSCGKKRALLLSHEFSMTGAPIVLVSIVPVLKSLGYDVVVLGPEWDNAAPLFVDAGATVVICETKLENSAMFGLALCSDFVLANTVVESRAIHLLENASVPVVWWLHDAFFGYPFIEDGIPKSLGSNVRAYAVGHHAAAAMHSVRPDFQIEQLLYGLPDLTLEPRADRDFTKDGKVLFINVGSVDKRKGQDILARAIRKLPAEDLAKAHFLFAGKPIDPEIFREVESLTQQYPENVSHIPWLSREEIKALMSQCNCIVCSSRDDPMPTFVTEGAMFGKPSIISEHTGTAALISQAENGFVYRNDSAKELSKLLQNAIREPEKLAAMAPACRALYEENFTQDKFYRNVSDMIAHAGSWLEETEVLYGT